MTQAEKKKSTQTISTSHQAAKKGKQGKMYGLSAHTGTRAGNGKSLEDIWNPEGEGGDTGYEPG